MARLGERLYDLDEASATGLLAASGAWRGATAARVRAAVEGLARLWPAWAALRDRLGEASDAVDRRDWADVDARLSRPVTDLADDPATHLPPAALLDLLWARADEVAAQSGALVEATSHLAPRVTDLRTRLDGLVARATAIGVEHDTEVAEAAHAVAHVSALAAGDPLHAEADRAVVAAAEALSRAYALVTTLEAQRDGLDDDLRDASTRLDELAVLVGEGRDHLVRARDRVAAPSGLLAPLDLAVLDDEPLGLRPWLARIRRAAERGDWRAASIGLHRWRQVADVHVEHARAVAAANAAPVARRDELRGLLGGLRARAAAGGGAEDPALSQLHDRAHDLLHVAPCDLDAAAAAVDAYRRAVLVDGADAAGGAR